MKQNYLDLSIGNACKLFGKTRHAYYDHIWRQEDSLVREDIVLQMILEIRATLPRVGTRKLQFMLTPMLEKHNITIGRDYLFDLLSEHRLLVKQRRRSVVTTDSRHWMRKYMNLVKNIPVVRPEQVWVSDITYIRMINQWGYLSLITDAFSRKIMGHAFRQDLSAKGCLDALNMAIKNRNYDHELIHHSDRGSQYCSHDYVAVLTQNKIGISMTENGDPYENALAERVNGIIKNEFNLHTSQLGFEQTATRINNCVQAYNQIRPHSSCDYLTPSTAHQNEQQFKKRWKNYHKKFTFEKTIV
jgi:putative transposase